MFSLLAHSFAGAAYVCTILHVYMTTILLQVHKVLRVCRLAAGKKRNGLAVNRLEMSLLCVMQGSSLFPQ